MSLKCEIPLDQLKSARTRQFHFYWLSKMRGAILPAREDIDPTEIKSLLPFLLLVDIEANPFRVRYRLCGSMVQRYDEELTGKYLDDLRNATPDSIELIYQCYRVAVVERRPVFARIPGVSRATGSILSLEGAIWPLSSDGQLVDKCAAIEDFPSVV